MSDLMLRIDNVSKQYKLGQIGGTTLRDELQRWAAKRRGQEDPTKRIGAKEHAPGETFLALDGVSFDVARGERVGIIGHNGAGKSTLLKLISRVTAPTSGTIGLNGRVASMLEVGTGFHGELTGRENIYMNGAILGMTRREIDAKMEDIIEFSECRQFIDTPVKRYSSGMYVKLAFSVAAHLDSEIMIMDEVLAVGDMAFQKKCLEKMEGVSRADGRTILYVSHNMNTIRQLCERVVTLDHGKLVFDGDVEAGISLYMGGHAANTSHINLESIYREPWASTRDIEMTAFDFMDVVSPVFGAGCVFDASISYIAHHSLEGLSFRIVLRDEEGVPVAMAKSSECFDVAMGERGNLLFTLDISHLAPGVYQSSLLIYKSLDRGTYEDFDCLLNAVRFEVRPSAGFNHNISWKKGMWGHSYLGDLSMKKAVKGQRAGDV